MKAFLHIYTSKQQHPPSHDPVGFQITVSDESSEDNVKQARPEMFKCPFDSGHLKHIFAELYKFHSPASWSLPKQGKKLAKKRI